MEPSALYYTLSTIAQTLAAAFAVLGAFVLFRLQIIETSVAKANSDFGIYRRFMSGDEIKKLLIEGGYDAVATRLTEVEAATSSSITRQALEDACAQFLLWWPVRQRVLSLLRLALWVTAGDIVLCLVALPYVPVIANVCWLYVLVTTAAVGISVLALFIYARLIFAQVHSPSIGPSTS